MAVRVACTADAIEHCARSDEAAHECQRIGVGACRLRGVAADGEHVPDAVLSEPGDDLVEVVLGLDHAGRKVGDDHMALISERRRHLKRGPDPLDRRTRDRDRRPER